jgi:SpoVK/Ycf46/Vps4 family AAA+-type ATPase
LNCLDGIQRADGLIVLMTTNHLEKIDPALGQPHSIASRPGRIDRTIMMNGLDSAGREKLATRILRGYPEWIEKVSADGIDDTPAQFQERCGRLALQLHYRDPELLPDSLSLPTAVGLPKEHSSNIEEEIGFAI